MWKRTGILSICGLMGWSEPSRVVMVSCGAATIQVSGGWLSSALGESALRHPRELRTRSEQKTAETREGTPPSTTPSHPGHLEPCRPDSVRVKTVLLLSPVRTSPLLQPVAWLGAALTPPLPQTIAWLRGLLGGRG